MKVYIVIFCEMTHEYLIVSDGCMQLIWYFLSPKHISFFSMPERELCWKWLARQRRLVRQAEESKLVKLSFLFRAIFFSITFPTPQPTAPQRKKKERKTNQLRMFIVPGSQINESACTYEFIIIIPSVPNRLNQFKIRKKLKQFCVDTCLSRRN
jgi:hypothetical protein